MSVPVETCITEASHAACFKSVIGIAPVSTPVEIGTAGSIQDVAISGLSTSSVADRSSSGSLDLSEEPLVLSEEPLARVGSARSTPPSDLYLSGSLDLPAEPLARGGSARSTAPADRVTLGLSVGVLMMVLEALRLVLCRLGAGSGVLLLGNSSSSMISLL